MPGKLLQEIKQRKAFRSLQAEVVLNIFRTADALNRHIENMLKQYGLTPAQYNVLRILRGAGETGATCSEVGERMIKRDPDITRMLDRLEKRGLIERSRSGRDRRVVMTTITPEGRHLVNELDAPMDELHVRQLEGFSNEQLAEIVETMEKIRNTKF